MQHFPKWYKGIRENGKIRLGVQPITCCVGVLEAAVI